MLILKSLLAISIAPVTYLARAMCGDIESLVKTGRFSLDGPHPRPTSKLQFLIGGSGAAAIAISPPLLAAPVALFAYVAVLISIIDQTTGLIPNRLIYPALAAGLFVSAAQSGVVSLESSIIGALGTFAVVASTSLLSVAISGPRTATLGMGDWKLGATIGAWLGLMPSLAAFVAALATCIGVMTWQRRRLVMVPFAPTFCFYALFFALSDILGVTA